MNSVKAQEIHDWIVNSNRTDYWTGVAWTFVEKRRQYWPWKSWIRDRPGFVERLRTELAGQITGANDGDWGEVADWLFGLRLAGKA